MKRFIINILLELLWRLADDITMTYVYLDEIYNNVPEHLKKETVKHYDLYLYDKENRKEILEFLDEDD